MRLANWSKVRPPDRLLCVFCMTQGFTVLCRSHRYALTDAVTHGLAERLDRDTGAGFGSP